MFDGFEIKTVRFKKTTDDAYDRTVKQASDGRWEPFASNVVVQDAGRMFSQHVVHFRRRHSTTCGD
jgi:hypothetical protein